LIEGYLSKVSLRVSAMDVAAAAAAFGAIINAAGRRGNRDSLGGRAKVWLMWVFVFRCLVVGW